MNSSTIQGGDVRDGGHVVVTVGPFPVVLRIPVERLKGSPAPTFRLLLAFTLGPELEKTGRTTNAFALA